MEELAGIFDFSHLINIIVVLVAWSIRQELAHIRESIDNAKSYAIDAKDVALKAHVRIDGMLERL